MDRTGWKWILIALLVAGVLGGGQIGGAAASSDDVFRLAQTFVRLAALDLDAAVEVWFSPVAQASWDRTARDALGDPIRGAAFFSSAAWFVAQPAVDAWIVGLYNPWVGGLVVLELPVDADRVVGFSLVSVSVDPVPVVDGAGFERALLIRVVTGAQAFDDVRARWSSERLPRASVSAWTSLKTQLVQYASALRDELSPEGQANLSGLRANLADVLDGLAQGSVPAGLTVASGLPIEWRESASAVWFALDGATAQVALGSPLDPLTVLWLRLATGAGAQPIQDARVVDVVGRLTSAEGERNE